MVETPPKDSHFDCVDGLRGFLAVWVFAYHASVMASWRTSPFREGAIAVDIFMFISGFLMAWNFHVREGREPLGRPATIFRFVVRRFFRLAPVYYILFAIAFALTQFYIDWNHQATTILAPNWASRAHYDPSLRAPTLTSALLHLSFLFGLFPQYASNNVLPDWSLALEMQFYVAVPFLLLFARRFGYTALVVGCVAVQLAVTAFVGLYFEPKQLGFWPQPAFLPFKITCFLAGMLLAAYTGERRDVKILILFFFVAFFRQSTVFALAAMLMLILIGGGDGSVRWLRDSALSVLDSRVARFLGKLSYSVYLGHMLILPPLLALLLSQTAYQTFLPPVRFGILFTGASLILLPLAYGLHRLIELPGIELGRRLLRRTRTAADRPEASAAGPAT